MKANLIRSTVALALLTLLVGIVYPLFMWGVGHLFFRKEANGTLYYYQDGTVIGSQWIGQFFVSREYFHSRPSAANFDASNSSGSNSGPTSMKLRDTLRDRADAYRTENRLPSDTIIPAEAVTTSGSGLDPHISVTNARLQANRVAGARGMAREDLLDLIEQYTEHSFFGLFGEKRVNVLRINLALDGETQ